MALAFVPGYPPAGQRLLGRFLPPLAEGVAAHYVQKYTQPGDLVFDPFGAAPALAVEVLGLDRRLVVASFNPVSRLAVSLAVRPPTAAQLRSALTLLADAPIGGARGDRLETSLQRLYATTCEECEGEATADSFEWEAGDDAPVSKTYMCPRCQAWRQGPTTEADRALARRWVRGGLDYHFLLDRVAKLGDPDRAHAEEALAVYPPRALAAIGAALIKYDSLATDRETRRLLAGLMLAALDASTALGPERPKALTLPRRYTETNLWLALEAAVGLLAGAPAPDRARSLDQLLSDRHEPGIHAYAGSVRDLAAQLPPRECALVLTAVPRPSQAYWTLSALWSAWLWGRESAEALRAVLRRRRYDWAWHARALQRTFAVVAPTVRRNGRLVGLVPEAEPGFAASVLAAGAGAELSLEGAVLRADTAEAQVVWAPPRPPSPRAEAAAKVEPARLAREAALACLRARGEPSRWASLHFAAWQSLAALARLPWDADDPLAPVNRALEPVWNEARWLQRLGAAAESDHATGLYWLGPAAAATDESVPMPNVPLADRVEAEVARQLADAATLDENDLHPAVCAAFPGPETPGRGLVAACLASYGERLESGLWRLRAEDEPEARAAEVEAMLAALRALGTRHGYEVALANEGGAANECGAANPEQVWHEAGTPAFRFVVLASAAISRYVLAEPPPARQRFLVVPGGRAGLVEYKLRRDPRLRAALQSGVWRVLKFRHVRRMAADAELTRATLEPALAADPLEGGQQLALPV